MDTRIVAICPGWNHIGANAKAKAKILFDLCRYSMLLKVNTQLGNLCSHSKQCHFRVRFHSNIIQPACSHTWTWYGLRAPSWRISPGLIYGYNYIIQEGHTAHKKGQIPCTHLWHRDPSPREVSVYANKP